MTDLLLEALDSTPFTWGRANLNERGDARNNYLEALRAADTGDYSPLFRFVRS